MYYPVSNYDQIVRKLREYISDSRPLNIDEMRSILDVMEKMQRPLDNLLKGVKRENIPYHLQNDFEEVKRRFNG